MMDQSVNYSLRLYDKKSEDYHYLSTLDSEIKAKL